ncbi:DUF2634 domain-containing protein [Paenibacillus albicereus]|uniref:DUF2634 domain-containing protein n=1 Tax=Paenibacillus albicereus TaxID=2726185 RepID=A0A6H2GZE1_9BACL|nr:DUF2634 domain-containing protein [Paenibacillus albicereus]QJC52780.1 DUF2634 domain-containing protein [Paenibacillus albicereus]
MADDLFPFIDGVQVAESVQSATEEPADLPLFREYVWDFSLDDFVLRDGNPVLIEGIDAIRTWISKTLRTERFRYLAYSWDYGQELDSLLGQRSVPDQSEAERFVKEALGASPYIQSLTDFQLQQDADTLSIHFTANTVYGGVVIDGFQL